MKNKFSRKISWMKLLIFAAAVAIGSSGLFVYFQQPAQGAAACPVVDGGAGDADGEVNGTLVIGADATWSADSAEEGVIDCGGLDIVVNSGVTLTFASAEDGDTDYTDDYGVTLLADNLTVEGVISADGEGYPGSNTTDHQNGYGPQGGAGTFGLAANGGGGGGHGGRGGTGNKGWSGGEQFGDAISPTSLGSGGGTGDYNVSVPGGAGGGAIKLQISGIAIINGTVSANGNNGHLAGGGGAGGSIWIESSSLAGVGSITAIGGNGGTGDDRGAGGGGGRVAIFSNEVTFSGTSSAAGGALSAPRPGEGGTIFILENNTGTLTIPGTQRWVAESPTTFHDWFGEIRHVNIINNSVLSLESGNKNTDSDGYGWSMDVENLMIEAGSRINGDGLGYSGGLTSGHSNGFGPGGGGYNLSAARGGSGGSHGGLGGDGYGSTASSINDSLTQPIHPGSGGGAGECAGQREGIAGGGALKVTASGTITLDGSITMNGGNASNSTSAGCRSGGGAGGSVWLTANTLTGLGPITVNGGNGGNYDGRGGAGSGGRIALYSVNSDYSGAATAQGGQIPASRTGADGTIYTAGLPQVTSLNQFRPDNQESIATGSNLNLLQVDLELGLIDGNASDILIPEAEIRSIDTPFTGISNLVGQSVVYEGDEVTGYLSTEQSEDWWNSEWLKRKEIVITNNLDKDLSNHQVEMTIEYDSDMQVDFADLRFLNTDSEVLNYWIEDFAESETAKVWIKVDNLPASGSKIYYMYYANQNAESESNADDTFIFIDHFDGSDLDTEKWLLSGSGVVGVQNGYAYPAQYGTCGSGWPETTITADVADLPQDFILSATVQHQNTGANAYMGNSSFALNDDGMLDADGLRHLWSDSWAGYTDNTWQVYAGGATIYSKARSSSYNNLTGVVSLISSDSNVIFTFDGQPLGVSQARPEIELSKLSYSFSRYCGYSILPINRLLDIKIRSYADVDPSVEIGSEQAPSLILEDMTSYHWQARACDASQVCSAWVQYGDNEEGETDFRVHLNSPPHEPTIPGSSGFINSQYLNSVQPEISFILDDPEEGDLVAYQFQLDDNADFSSPLIRYTSGIGSQGTRSFTVGQAEGDGLYLDGEEGQQLVEGTYYWRVKAIDGNMEESDWTAAPGSPAFGIDLTEPTNAAVVIMKRTASGSEIASGIEGTWTKESAPVFSWQPASDETGLKGYCLYLGTDSQASPGTTKGLLGSSPVSATGTNCEFITDQTSIDFATLAYRGGSWLSSSSAPYYFKVRAIDDAGNVFSGADATNTFSFNFDNTAPTNMTAVSTANGSFSSVTDMYFNWPTSGSHAASDTHSGLLGLQFAFNDTSEWYGEQIDETTGMTYIAMDYEQPYYLDSALADKLIIGDNTLYVRTIDIAGNVSVNRLGLLQYGGEAPTFSFDAEVSVTPEVNTENLFSLSWPAASPGDNRTIGSYYYMINTQPPSTMLTIESNSAVYIPSTSTNVAMRSLPNVRKGSNTVYVVAADNEGTYSPSNAIEGTFILNTDLPDPPKNISAADSSLKAADLWRASIVWDEPDYIGTGDLTYVIQRSENGADWEEVATTPGLAYVDTVPYSIKYFWRVGARDSSDESHASPSFSNAVSLTPKGAYTSPASLTSGPSASGVSTSKATVSWTTDRTADSRLSLGRESGEYDEEEITNTEHVTDHSLTLRNLEPATKYYYQAKWVDEDGNTGESEEKSFTTKPPPEVKEVVVKNIGINTALVEFTVKDTTGVNIYYGDTTEFGSFREVSTSTVETTYALELTELSEDTKYYFKLNTFDLENEEYEGTVLDFTTLPQPRVSGVQIRQVANTAQTTLQVSWQSNTPISSIVTFYPAGQPNLARDLVDIELKEGSHEMLVRGLFPDTNYVLAVRGRDRAGNEAVSSEVSFTTASDLRAPQLSSLSVEGANIPQVTSTAQETSAQLIVSWTTDEPATSQVEFGEGTGTEYSQITREDEALGFNHVVVISGLSPSQVYHLRAISKDAAGNVGTSIDTVTITPKATDNAFDLVMTNLREVFGFLSGGL